MTEGESKVRIVQERAGARFEQIVRDVVPTLAGANHAEYEHWLAEALECSPEMKMDLAKCVLWEAWDSLLWTDEDEMLTDLLAYGTEGVRELALQDLDDL